MISYANTETVDAGLRGIKESSGGGGREIPERLLWKLWKRRAARQVEFRTGAGTRIRVLYPGRTGTAAGPDFRDALLDVEGVGLVRGDVEIHRRQKDWDAHGHGDDPNYSGVVVHGALELEGPETELHSGMSAPVVSLSGLLDEPDENDADEPGGSQVTRDLWDLLPERGYSRPCSAEQAGDMLDRAGDERFRRKAATLGRFASEQGPEQTLYEALLEGLGYRNNQQPFVRLAQATPIEALRGAAQRVLTEQRPMVLRHWLLAVSGLSEVKGAALPSGLGPKMERKEWHLFRVRPSNHPAVRMEGAAELVARFLDCGLVAGLNRAAESPKSLTGALTVAGNNGGHAPIGEGRARDLAVNVVLPLLHSQTGNDDSQYLEVYRRFPKLPGNEVEREMAEQLFPIEWRGTVRTARRQQGLLHLAALLRGAG